MFGNVHRDGVASKVIKFDSFHMQFFALLIVNYFGNLNLTAMIITVLLRFWLHPLAA